MKHLVLLIGFAVISFGAYTNAQAENLSYMISGESRWSDEKLDKEIERTEDVVTLNQARLEDLKRERAERLAAIEAAAGEEPAPEYGHYIGH